MNDINHSAALGQAITGSGEPTAKHKVGDRVRIKFGRDRGSYATVVYAAVFCNDGETDVYYGIQLDAVEDHPLGYSEYELDPA
jgi:hypothetical protein